MKVNYHTHTPRCQHAKGQPEEYVLAAIEQGFDTLGFADHTPNNYSTGFVPTMRMRAEELPDYVADVRAAAEKYKDKIRVLCGLEAEYFPAHLGWIVEQKEKYHLDYLILGNHFDSTDEGGAYFGRCLEPAHLRRYVEMTARGMQTGEYMYLAHPDLLFAQYPSFGADAKAAARDLCAAARETNMPLEYNLLGAMRVEQNLFKGLGYPCPQFWEVVAEEKIPCIIGFDAHDPDQLRAPQRYANAVAYLDGLGLERLEKII